MDNEAEKEKLTPLGIKVNQVTKSKFYELREEGAFDTSGQFLDTLLERFSNPIKINQENKEKVAELTAKLNDMEAQNIRLKENAAAKDQEISRINGLLESHINEKNELSGQLEDMKACVRKNDGCIAVPVTQLDRMCLDYLSQRENAARKRNDITPEVLLIYVLREMLIKGNKFSIPCVPDSKIAEFKRRIKND